MHINRTYTFGLLLLVASMPLYMQDADSSGFVDQAQRDPGEQEETEINVEQKRKDVIALVNKGIEQLNKTPLDEALSIISHSADFRQGELYLFIYDIHGVCFAHGHHQNLIWSNLWDMRDEFGVLIVREIIKKANEGGGWLTYGWRNATKVAYAKKTSVNGKEYVVGCGYYPHSKRDSVVTLVKGAVGLFNQAIEANRPPDQVFALISYPLGQFVLGDLYLYALDFDGIIVAQGDSPGLIGNTAWDSADAKGRKINQEVINALKEAPSYWIEYVSKGATKRAYAEKVVDKTGKKYFIACGYYPETNRKQAVDLLRKGFRFMKANGLSATTESITSIYDNQFRYGDLYLVLYTPTGDCLAHGNNPALVGHNFWDMQDQDGKYYVRDIIQKALVEPSWVDYKSRNLFKSSYAEKIDLGTETYVLSSGLYPVSKRESAILLVKTAGDYLQAVPREEAFRDFTKTDGRFIRGDLHTFVFDLNGFCFEYGDNFELIWQNLINAKDDNGKQYVQLFINTAKNGAGQVSFKVNGGTKIGYVESVEKDGKTYVVGSSYYI